MLGTLHLVFAIAALAAGAIVVFRPKGDPRHRAAGYCYVASLLLVNVSALSVYEDSAAAGPFHVLAAISLVTLFSGFVPVLLRRPASRWLDLHAHFMSWSYVGLVAAGTAQLATMSSDLPGVILVGLPSVSIVIVGGVLIHTRVPGILAALASARVRRGLAGEQASR